MTSRKLIPQGGGGLTVYLPRKWLRKQGLQGGDEVSIEKNEDALVVQNPSPAPKQAIITIKDETLHNIKNLLTHHYRRGIEHVIIENADEKMQAHIKEVMEDLLLGFETTVQEEGRIELQNISEPSDEKYDAILRRVFLINSQLLKLLAEAGVEGFNKLGEVEQLRKNHERYQLFCRRMLIKQRFVHTPVLGWEMLVFLMHIAHGTHYAYKYGQENEVECNQMTAELLAELPAYFQHYSDGYWKKDLESVHELDKQRTEYELGRCYDAIRIAKNHEAVVCAHIRELYRLIHVGASPVQVRLIHGED